MVFNFNDLNIFIVLFFQITLLEQIDWFHIFELFPIIIVLAFCTITNPSTVTYSFCLHTLFIHRLILFIFLLDLIYLNYLFHFLFNIYINICFNFTKLIDIIESNILEIHIIYTYIEFKFNIIIV